VEAFCIRVSHLFLPSMDIPHRSAGVLPSNCCIRQYDFESLYDGVWAKGIWAPNVWASAEVEVGHNTRLKCAFVDYVNNNWVIGDKAITTHNLSNLITKLEEKAKLE
jgi:hypothetical protein